MKSLLLAAFVSLLRAVWASEPPAAGGFYLNQEPITVEKACSIMLNLDNFQELPGLSIATPLSVNDTAMLLQAVAPYSNAVTDEENALWHAWISALQLSEEHPIVQHCRTLYSHLVGAIQLIQMPHLTSLQLGPCKAGSSHLEASVRLHCDTPEDSIGAILIKLMLLQELSENSSS